MKNIPVYVWCFCKQILIAILVGWLVCGIMTAAGAFEPDDIYARTDSRLDVIRDAAWFKFPYPGKQVFI